MPWELRTRRLAAFVKNAREWNKLIRCDAFRHIALNLKLKINAHQTGPH